VRQRRIGDLAVGEIALGGADWSLREIDPAAVSKTIAAALEAGVTLIDTAYVYTTAAERNHNERLIAMALAELGAGDRAVVATKGGHYRSGDAFPIDGRPETIRAHCEASIQALGVEAISLYQLHLPDPKVPFAESVGALAELLEQGKVRRVGLSNVSLSQLEEARSIVPIASVQNHLSPWAGEMTTVPGGAPLSVETVRACGREGIAFLAYAPFLGPFDRDGEPLPRGERHGIAKVAQARGVSRHQVILAWLLAQGPGVIPIVGASRPASIEDSARASALELTEDELSLIASA
jgi:aryl-alcohol dehydrogenase-like predicted oxidoreductase